MADPYSVLGLDQSANGDAIRDRYLTLVQKYTPDRAPERFAQIQAAYNELKDVEARVKNQMYVERSGDDHIDTLLGDIRLQQQAKRLPAKTLYALMHAG